MTTPPDIKTKSGVFKNINSNCVLTVPTGKKAAYIAAGWTDGSDGNTAVFKEIKESSVYDINGDGAITIADAVLIVNEILNQ
jgi:hypothetical protein